MRFLNGLCCVLLALGCALGTSAQQLGGIENFVVSERFAHDVDGYFDAPHLWEARWFYEIYESSYDYELAQGTLEERLGYAAGSNSGKVYVPTNYDPANPPGLLLYINAGNQIRGFFDRYHSVFQENYLIGAAPHNVGNHQPDVLRFSHVLDMLVTLQSQYNIDADRIYVAGQSGGVVTATQLLYMYPQIFKGMVGNVRLLTEWEVPYFTRDYIERVAAEYQPRWTVATGADDFNYQHVLETTPIWRGYGFHIRLFDIPGMGHERASVDLFNSTIKWVDAPRHIAQADTYEDWSYYQFDERSFGGYRPNVDYDLDGVLNYQEYVFSSDPRNPQSKSNGKLKISVNDGIQLSFSRRAALSDYECVVGVSTNLTEWSYTHEMSRELVVTNAGGATVECLLNPGMSELGDSGFFVLQTREKDSIPK